jgi:hypothetical protein
MNSKRLIALAGLIAAAAVVGPAGATTYGTQGGAACHPTYPYPDSSATKLYHSENGLTTNDTASAKFVNCPIPRSNGLSSTGLSSAYVDMKDGTYGTSYCWLNAFDEYGNQLPGGSGTKYSGGAGNHEISFGSIAASDPWGFYGIFCALGAVTVPNPNNYDIIYSYQWAER